jgi:hypothetical protein
MATLTPEHAKECQICMENFTSSLRARVSCNSCNLEACRECVRKYLLNTSELPHCPNQDCKCSWDRQFLIDNTLKAFVNGKYKKHRADILLEQEKARMPETMPALENYRNLGKLQKEVSVDGEKLDEILAQYTALRININQKKNRIKRIKRGDCGEEKKREFKQKCGVSDCVGFLSSAWKCGACDTWTCSKCFEIIGTDKNCGHECDTNNVESAKLIKKETRNCPSCATSIFKIEGCDQMWCTQCHVAFSWKTGMQVNGVVHNPHFYNWQREGGQAAPIQTPGAQVCGGLPNGWNFRRQLNLVLTGNKQKGCDISTEIMRLHAGAAHFQHWELDKIRRDCQNASNTKQLRIRYLCKEITEEQLKQKLQQNDKKKEKKMAQLQIYELINSVFMENLNDIQQMILEIGNNAMQMVDTRKKVIKTCETNITRCHKLRIYANKQMLKISKTYQQNVGMLNHHFRTLSMKIGNSTAEEFMTKHDLLFPIK